MAKVGRIKGINPWWCTALYHIALFFLLFGGKEARLFRKDAIREYEKVGNWQEVANKLMRASEKY